MANDFVKIDTEKIDEVISRKSYLIQEYDEINQEYKQIVKTLLENWEGRGAASFKDDSAKVKKNIQGIADILKIMCDTLEDCKAVIAEVDASLGNYNREQSIKGVK